MLFISHAKMLAASGIPPGLATRRGYESVTTLDHERLLRLGFSRNAVKRIGGFPPDDGLLIPLLDKRGSVWGYQLRPDSPYLPNGKLGDGSGIRKYETPIEQRNGLDIPPGESELLDAPGEPMFVTRGDQESRLCCRTRSVLHLDLRRVELARGQSSEGEAGGRRLG
jgi:hypothetical protein